MIAQQLEGRTDVQCLHRWQKVLKPGLVKGPWTAEEDNMVRQLVQNHGTKKWSLIAMHLEGRLGKQCRERWYNHLDPNIKRTPWCVFFFSSRVCVLVSLPRPPPPPPLNPTYAPPPTHAHTQRQRSPAARAQG